MLGFGAPLQTHKEVVEKWIASILERGFHAKIVCLLFVFLRAYRWLILKK